MGRLPDFLLVGAPKCGTSALHGALATHPRLFLPEVKEPTFFLTDEAPPPAQGGGPGDVATWGEHVWRRADYEALFDPAPPEALAGEGTVFYLYEPERRAAGWAHFWHYVAQGRYGEQLEHLRTLFDPAQILVLRYRDLREAPVCTADRVCAFLGVETGAVHAVPRRNVRSDVSARTRSPSAAERAEAVGWFADDVARLEAILGRDLSDWVA